MNAKLGNLSEISKLLSVKSKMSGDILSLFSKFGLGHLLCRLSLEKHDGISAVQLILSLCLFREGLLSSSRNWKELLLPYDGPSGNGLAPSAQLYSPSL